jgi:hypothetical protein
MEFLGWIWSLVLFVWGLEEFFLADLTLQFKDLTPVFRYLPAVLFVAAILTSFPFIHRLLGQRSDRKAHHFFVYLGIIGFLTMVLHWNSVRVKNGPQLSSFRSHVGHCNPILGPWMQTGVGNFLVRKTVNGLPLIAQYVYWAGEDLCRALKLKKIFENPQPPICHEMGEQTDSYLCLKNVLIAMGPHSKMGMLLHLQTGMKVLGARPEGSSQDQATMAAVGDQVQATLKLGDFVLFLNQIKTQSGAPEEILDRMQPEQREKMMNFAKRYLPANMPQPASGQGLFELPAAPQE